MHEHSIQSLKAKLKDRDGDLQALRRELDENELERAELGEQTVLHSSQEFGIFVTYLQ